MSSLLTFLLSITCIIPAVTGLVLYRRVDRKVHPFVWIMCLSVATELIARLGLTMRSGFLITTTYNLFIPANLWLFLLFFLRNGVIRSERNLQLVMATSLMVWIGCWIYHDTWQVVFMFSHVYNSAIIVICAIQLLTRETLQTRQAPLKNFFFLVSCSCIIVYLFYIFITSTMLLSTGFAHLRAQLYHIYQYINAASYLLFAYAIICLTKAKIYSR